MGVSAEERTMDPRSAALRHAGLAVAQPDRESASSYDLSDLASAVACGLVYVGDQIREAGERPTALQLVLPNAQAVTAWRSMDAPAPVGEKQVRALTACALELDGQRYELAVGDSLTVPGLLVRLAS